MTGRIPAPWQWHSRQGTNCTENRDACGILECGTYTFCVVVDASPRGERGIPFNACWIASVLDRLGPGLPSIDAVLAALREGQQHLRAGRFFAEKASYIAVLLPRDAQDAHVFWCGDCTLGIQSPEGTIEWLTRPHTLDNVLEDLNLDADATKRHIVTRTLNARRFQTPEVRTIPAHAPGWWVLATDGYRYQETDDTGHPKDDCSALLIGNGLAAGTATAQTNLLVRTFPATNDGHGPRAMASRAPGTDFGTDRIHLAPLSPDGIQD